MRCKNTLLAAVAIAASLLAPLAQASTITTLAGTSPTVAGNGLNGAYWNTSGSMSNNAAADAASVTSATATFLAKLVDYGNGSSVPDSTPLSSFLGNNAANLSGASTNTLDTSVYRFTGFLNITQAMDTQAGNGTIDVNFRVGSDDGMRLRIGGVDVATFDAPRAYAYSNGTASFASAGLYAVDLLFWENYGNTGVDLQWQTGSSSAFQDVSTASLYTAVPAGHVPEPATLALVGLGFLAARSARRR